MSCESFKISQLQYKIFLHEEEVELFKQNTHSKLKLILKLHIISRMLKYFLPKPTFNI